MLEIGLSVLGIGLLVTGLIMKERSNNQGQEGTISWILIVVGGLLLVFVLIVPAARCGFFDPRSLLRPETWDFSRWGLADWADLVGGLILAFVGAVIFLRPPQEAVEYRYKVAFAIVVVIYLWFELLTVLPAVDAWMVDMGLFKEPSCVASPIEITLPKPPAAQQAPSAQPVVPPQQSVGNVTIVVTDVITITIPMQGAPTYERKNVQIDVQRK